MFDKKEFKRILKPIVIERYKSKNQEIDLYKNTLDCFSCVIDSACNEISVQEWLNREKRRQTQKTFQNDIGNMHQKLLGTHPDLHDLGVGEILDLKSDTLKLVAEIKNKHNTTKGNHKVVVYDDIVRYLESVDEEYIGYYVEVLPPKAKKYNEPFMPSDNKTKKKRPENLRIRKIDGASFYELVTGDKNAIRKAYDLIIEATCDILNENCDLNSSIDTLGSNHIDDIFNKAYKIGL